MSFLNLEFIIFRIKFFDSCEENLVNKFHDKSTAYNKRSQIFKSGILNALNINNYDIVVTLLTLMQKLQDYIVNYLIIQDLQQNR